MDDLRRLDPGVEQEVVDEVLRGAVLGVDDGLALEVAGAADIAPHHDPVAPVRPVDLLEDARCRARVLEQLGREQHHHVQGSPENVAFARSERIARHDRVVDQLEVDLEPILLEEDAVLVGPEAVVGGDDRQPADPHVDRELDHLVVGVPLVVADALDRRQTLGGLVGVLVDRRDAARVGRLDLALLLTVGVQVDLALLGPARHDPVAEEVHRAGDQHQHEDADHQLAEGGRSDFVCHLGPPCPIPARGQPCVPARYVSPRSRRGPCP